MSPTTAVIERDPPPINAAVVRQTMEMLKTIRDFVAAELRDGLDFGLIPGTSGNKKALLLPGAQKVCMLYNCYPKYDIQTTELDNGHVDFRVTTQLIHRATDCVVGSGVGSCSTMESKYRWRNATRKCPKCGKEAIIKGKAEYGGGWLCFKKKDGCGATFPDSAPDITQQKAGRVENADIYDVRNTVLKIAKKRSAVDACISLGCLAELFTQDLEEEAGIPEHEPGPLPRQEPAHKPANGHGMPANGKELYTRLKAKGEQLAAEGYTAAKNLATMVAQAGRAKNFPPMLGDYSADQVAWAVKAATLLIEKIKADAEPIHADEASDLSDLASQCTEDRGDLMAYLGLPRETEWTDLTVAQARVLRDKLTESAKQLQPAAPE